MSLQFVIGEPGSGKSTVVYDRMIAKEEKNPRSHQMLLVPEQASLTVQQELIASHKRHGLLSIEVMSFTRLSYRVFEELHLTEKKLLDENGKSMVVRRILSEKKDELTYFGGNVTRSGFVSECRSLLSEFQQCLVDAKTLAGLSEKEQDNPAFLRKLHDLILLTESFDEALSKDYTTAEERLVLLRDVIAGSEKLKNTEVTIEDFNGFTPVQYEVLAELLSIVPKLTVVITMRPEALSEEPSEYELFSMSRKMMNRFIKMAEERHVQIDKPVILRENIRFGNAPDLMALSKNFDAVLPVPYREKPEHIHLYTARNPKEEVLAVLEEILALIRKGCCYRDIAIVTGDAESYAPLIRMVFEKAGLPVFIDEKRQIEQTPFVRFLFAALSVVEENFSYESVFRFLKSGFVLMDASALDRVENYVLALGIRGKSGYQKEWTKIPDGTLSCDAVLSEYNEVRKEIADLLIPFADTMNEKDLSVRDRIDAVNDLFDRCLVKEQLSSYAERFAAEKDFAREREFAQIYDKTQDLFDQMVTLMGGEILSCSEFEEILRAGFDELSVGVLPPTMDRIVVGDIRRTRFGQIRAMFVLGANDGLLPPVPKDSGLLTESDRQIFASSDVELSDSTRDESFHERFYLYLMLTRASDLLCVYCSENAGDGKALRPSGIYSDLTHIFPALTVKEKKTDGILTPRLGVSSLAEGIRDFSEGEEDPKFAPLFTWYESHPDYKDTVDSLLQAAFDPARKESLTRQTCELLYGENPAGSVTRLESFASCAYAHFLTYGLRLHERRQYELQAVDIGNVCHDALDLFFRKMEEEGNSFEQLSEEGRKRLVKDSVREATENYDNTIFTSSAKNEAVLKEVGEVMDLTVRTVLDQLASGSYVPFGSEQTFSAEDGIRSLKLTMKDGRKETLSGRIDRIDLAFSGEKIYVRIIDYKTGNTAFDYSRIYEGLQLQLSLYLGAATELVRRKYPDRDVIPAGVFYYNIADPVREELPDASEEARKEDRMKSLRMNGVTVKGEEPLSLLETEHGKSSLIVRNLKYSADGDAADCAAVVSEKELSLLSDFAKEKSEELIGLLMSGDISVDPFEVEKGSSSCSYCPYLAVCGFDAALPDRKKRHLKSMKAEEFFQKVEGKGGKD